MENTKNEKQCAIHEVSNSVDFWKDAQEFLKSQLPDAVRRSFLSELLTN